MRNVRSILAALAVGALAAGPLAGAAGAALVAPTYQSSDPEDGAMMDHPPSEVTVTFSEPLDASSEMSVFDECGTEIDSGDATVNLTEMQVGIDNTPAGTYKVVYTAVGLAGVTGETKGSFDFMVHHGKPCKKGAVKHPDHGNHGKGKKKDREHDHDGDGKDDHDDMSSGHSGGDHDSGSDHDSGGNHDSGSTTHSGGHMPSGSGNGSGHGSGHGGPGHGKGKGIDDAPTAGSPNPPVAAGPGGITATADAEAMLIGLGLALLVGVLGGWLLRNSGGLADPA